MPNYGQCPEYAGSKLKCVSEMSMLPYAVLSIPAHRRQNSVIHCHAYHPWCRNPAATEIRRLFSRLVLVVQTVK